MKIVSVETFLVAPRWLFCRIGTDEGIVGWGEPVVEGRAEVVRSAVEVLAEYLIGEDPLRIEQHWQVLTKGGFYRGGPVLSSAVAGVDQALWDIAGKFYGAPVHALLGGAVRDRVRVYAWVGGDEPGEVTDAVTAHVEAGMTAVKLNASGVLSPVPTLAEVNAVVKRVGAARAALGDDRDVAVDLHGRATFPAARMLLPALAPLQPLLIEEPLLPEHGDRLPELVAHCSVPVATGERLYHRSDFLPALRAGISVVQPDLSHAGGISEVRRIASLAETHGALFAPHCPLGPISLAASLQTALATPNFLIQEQSMGIHYNVGAELLDYVADPEPLRIVDGHIARLEQPGLGITVDEDAVRRADRSGHAWRNPVWRHHDGSFAEW
ncbi:galactonate dehydratase [Cryptosporangium aurantiacum]|uniref:Galactonate dehydratase n=1 Tax=Cryptosporangium aurantiacum TaxID=134849 RepID=A0A1M7QSX2_9ACTN|nr:galactonate dehydratase [Cryptosporangium aurantiacum]SHN34458.1 galactonate dehydratase [Cryptosporangium aurantiacum]